MLKRVVTYTAEIAKNVECTVFLGKIYWYNDSCKVLRISDPEKPSTKVLSSILKSNLIYVFFLNTERIKDLFFLLALIFFLHVYYFKRRICDIWTYNCMGLWL